MRLGALLLTPVLGLAQAPPASPAPARPLPWENAAPVPWQREPSAASPWKPSAPMGPRSEGALKIRLFKDGTLLVVDAAGVVRLRLGLPGRPLRAWRDGGLPVPLGDDQVLGFPDQTPLAKDLGGMAWGAEDFRPSLSGLFWVLDDGENCLTVVHPATARAAYLPLPPGQDFELAFGPDHLGLRARSTEGPGAPEARWTLPWAALLPRFAALAADPARKEPGTALVPFKN